MEQQESAVQKWHLKLNAKLPFFFFFYLMLHALLPSALHMCGQIGHSAAHKSSVQFLGPIWALHKCLPVKCERLEWVWRTDFGFMWWQLIEKDLPLLRTDKQSLYRPNSFHITEKSMASTSSASPSSLEVRTSLWYLQLLFQDWDFFPFWSPVAPRIPRKLEYAIYWIDRKHKEIKRKGKLSLIDQW